MPEILTMRDLFGLAEEMHQEGIGKGTGLLPMFELTRWLNERMGLPWDQRRSEVHYLAGLRISECRPDFEPTADAVAFRSLYNKGHEFVETLMAKMEERIRERRKAPPVERLRVRAKIQKGVRPDWIGNFKPDDIVFHLVGVEGKRPLTLREFLSWACSGETEVRVRKEWPESV